MAIIVMYIPFMSKISNNLSYEVILLEKLVNTAFFLII